MPSLHGNVLYGFDRQVAEWVGTRIDGFNISDEARALGVVRNGKLVAGVVYERYNGVHMECSIAVESASWATRDTLDRLFSFPFIQHNCLALTVLVPVVNLKSINLASKLGFEAEALVKFAAPSGGHLLVMKMFKDKCPWIGGRNGKRLKRTGGAGSIQDGKG